MRVAVDADQLVGGIAYERYPRSGCGLITYLVVAPAARGRGLGARLLREATHALHVAGAPVVLGEVNDPRRHHGDGWPRLARFRRWGARVLEARYVQPALGPGLARDRDLVLIALAGATPLPPRLAGGPVRAFVDELYAVTERAAPDPEVAIPDLVELVELGP